jgi:Ca-activated chloride channel family protein
MDKNRKLGLMVLGFLFLGTLGARAAYKVRTTVEPDTHIAATLAPMPEPPVLPWTTTPDPVASTELAQSDVVSVSTALDRTAVLQHGDGVVHVEVDLGTEGLGGGERVPTDFVVVLDRSGSMEGQKLEFGKQALRELVGRLGDDDRLGLVTYESGAVVQIPLSGTARTSRNRWIGEVDRIDTAGGTNMSGGLDLAFSQLAQNRRKGVAARMLVLSDGLANEGDSSRAGLTGRARRAAHDELVLSTVGIGADFDEGIMTSLARSGTGAFYYLANLDVLPKLLSAELKTANETYAQGTELRVRLAPGVRVSSVSGGVFDQHGDSVVVPLGSLYARHSRRVWLTLQMPTNDLRESDLADVSVRYRHDGKPFEVHASALPHVACVASAEEFQAHVIEKVWENAVLEEEINRGKEALGEAIRSGTPADVDRAVASATSDQALAEKLGNQKVLKELEQMNASSVQAKAAQRAPALERANAAKDSLADGFSGRNSSLYKNIDPYAAFRK